MCDVDSDARGQPWKLHRGHLSWSPKEPHLPGVHVQCDGVVLDVVPVFILAKVIAGEACL